MALGASAEPSTGRWKPPLLILVASCCLVFAAVAAGVLTR